MFDRVCLRLRPETNKTPVKGSWPIKEYYSHESIRFCVVPIKKITMFEFFTASKFIGYHNYKIIIMVANKFCSRNSSNMQSLGTNT